MNVILKHAERWLHFQDPERVLIAERVEDVLPQIQEAEASGLFAAGFISYEAAPAFDSVLKTHVPDGFPLLCLGLFHAPKVLETIELGTVDSETVLADQEALYDIGELTPSVSKDDFVSAIGAVKERIAQGATYQVNYTYRLNASFSGDPWAFFCELVKGQKTEFAAFVETDQFTICSASPELFFSVNNGQISARPMKGTAKRGRTFAEDWKQSQALQASEKDRAENIMIVDMIRNDIGRIAEVGCVETMSTYDVEKYPTVWQMTSTVRGKLCADATKASTILKALFPCASITGAPKAKTMEIIHDLECSPRKIYTGSIGFISPQGEACFNVAIRTALIDHQNGCLEFGVGGGIVWDSDADSEYEETLTKARVLTQPRPEFQVLETMLWEPGNGIFLLNEHLQRLSKTAAFFDVPVDIYEVVQAIENLGDERLRVRLLVDRDGGFEVQTFPLAKGADMPLRVILATDPIDSRDLFLFHKTTHREVYDAAKAGFSGFDDVILWNERGEITEGCIANVVIRKGGKFITPPIECGLLGGTFRESLLKSGKIEEGLVMVNDLFSADEVFLVNSVRKWQKAMVERG